jgi:hypothetical protein
MFTLKALHSDERGTISILSVITIFALMMVLGMVINAGRQVDEKVRLQNAADAAAYSGGAVIARGLNALAFSNHLEGEIFGLVAVARTFEKMGQDPTTLNSENAILDAWNQVGQNFAASSFPKFAALGPAIQRKVPLEKELVKNFLEMGYLYSKLVKGPLESILRGPAVQPGGAPDPQGGVIPRFQRAIVLNTPQTAQLAAAEIARMHGNMTSTGKVSGLEKLHGRQPLSAILWRTNAVPVSLGIENDPMQRTLPVFDPSPSSPDGQASPSDPIYIELARCQRRRWATATSDLWMQTLLDPFYRGIPNPGPGGATSAKMSAMYWNFKAIQCGALNRLLDIEYRTTNLPHLYRVPNNGFSSNTAGFCLSQTGVYDCNCLQFGNPDVGLPGYVQLMYQNVDPKQNQQQPAYLEQMHSFVGVVYWPRMQQTSSLYFRYPLASDAIAFAQVSVFVPKALYMQYYNAWGYYDSAGNFIPYYDFAPQHWDRGAKRWYPLWDLTSQNWMVKLAPATSDNIGPILQSSLAQQFVPNVRTPSLGGIAPADLRRINTH